MQPHHKLLASQLVAAAILIGVITMASTPLALFERQSEPQYAMIRLGANPQGSDEEFYVRECRRTSVLKRQFFQRTAVIF